jgi:hypothetical protein
MVGNDVRPCLYSQIIIIIIIIITADTISRQMSLLKGSLFVLLYEMMMKRRNM